MYAVDWCVAARPLSSESSVTDLPNALACWRCRALTLFTRSLPLHLALRIWDGYVLLGTPFFFQASMGATSSLIVYRRVKD